MSFLYSFTRRHLVYCWRLCFEILRWYSVMPTTTEYNEATRDVVQNAQSMISNIHCLWNCTTFLRGWSWATDSHRLHTSRASLLCWYGHHDYAIFVIMYSCSQYTLRSYTDCRNRQLRKLRNNDDHNKENFYTQISWFMWERSCYNSEIEKKYFSFLQSYCYINILCHIFNFARDRPNQQQLVIIIAKKHWLLLQIPQVR